MHALLEAPSTDDIDSAHLRFTMPSSLCSYCLGERRIGKPFLRGNVKSMFKEVRLHFGKDDYVETIELVEGTGDRTVIKLSSVKYNTEVDPSLFTVR